MANEKIAVLGAGGMMGFAIARNLAAAGFEVRAWNRSREKAEPLAKDGAEIADTPAGAAGGAGAILTMLADADAVTEAIRDAFTAEIGPDTLWLQMSTIGERGTEECMRLAQERGVTFVDAPALGTKEPAEQGKLVIMASGPKEARERLEPIFEAIGQRSMWVGEAGAGTKLKMVTNAWILAVMEASAETLALAEGLGLDPQLVLDAVEGGPLDLPYLQMKGKAIIERKFDPSFRLALAAKDASLVQDSAARRALDLPLLATIRKRLDEAVPDHGDEDMSATYLTSAPGRAAALSIAASPARYDGLELMALGGEWRAGSSEQTRADVDPWSGATLLEMRLADRDDLERAFTTGHWISVQRKPRDFPI